MRPRLALVMVLASLVALVAVGSAHATFPGANGKLSFSSDQNGNGDYDLYSINANGSGVRRITSGPGSDLWSDWSPTANKIAFERDLNHTWEVHTINADGTGDTVLATGENPAWSPDGQKIAYGRIGYDDQGGGIFVMNADGSSVTKIAPGYRDSLQPDWSPDGSKLVFNVQSPGDPGALYTVNADGTGLTRLPGNDWDFDPSWSPQGDKIAFAGGPGATQPQIYIANPDGTGRVALTTTGGTQPVWSPDGQKIAFTNYVDSRDEIYTMNADGSGQFNVTNSFPGSAFESDWAALIYPHPQSAPSIHAALVPAFRQCGTSHNPATGSHASPLAVGSCAPNPAATQAVIGPNGTAEDIVQVQASPADLTLAVAASDIRTPAGADYNPNGTGGNDLLATFRVRFTDRSNCLGNPCSTPYDKPATMTDLDFPPAHIDCVPNGDPATAPGSDCNVATSANTLVPGAVITGKQTILQVFRVRVLNDVGNMVFLQQGVFVP